MQIEKINYEEIGTIPFMQLTPGDILYNKLTGKMCTIKDVSLSPFPPLGCSWIYFSGSAYSLPAALKTFNYQQRNIDKRFVIYKENQSYKTFKNLTAGDVIKNKMSGELIKIDSTSMNYNDGSLVSDWISAGSDVYKYDAAISTFECITDNYHQHKFKIYNEGT